MRAPKRGSIIKKCNDFQFANIEITPKFHACMISYSWKEFLLIHGLATSFLKEVVSKQNSKLDP